MKNKQIEEKPIGTVLDEYIRENISYENATEENMRLWKREITKIVRRYFKVKTHQIFVVTYAVNNSFYALIGTREKNSNRFGFINCELRNKK